MVKFILGILIGVVAVIFIVQNTQIVDVTFLAWTLSMSRALMLFIILVIGFLLGWVVGGVGRRRKKETK